MIEFSPVKHILKILFTLLFGMPMANSQCPFVFVTYGDMAVAPAPGQTIISGNCHFVGEYATITNVVGGNMYNISYNFGLGMYLTIYDSALNPVAWGNSPINGFTPAVSGTYYINSFLSAGCADVDPSFTCNEGTWSNVTPFPPPTNDLPCGAIPLNPNANCNYVTYTNEYATAAPGVPAPGCAAYLGGDVWFSVIVPASGNVLIDTQVGVLLDCGMAVYTGTCSSLTLVECDDDDSPNGVMPSILISEPPGTQVFIRIWDLGNNNSGTFGICAQELPAPCVGPNLPSALGAAPSTICSGSSSTVSWTGALNDATQWHIYTGSCGGTQVGTSATNSFIVSPTVTTTYYVRGEDGAGCVDETTGICGSITVTVNPLDDAGFNYSAGSYCVNGSDPTPTITGSVGGSFSSSPAGLSINAATGAIDLSGSAPGAYSVTYTSAGSCPNSSNVPLTITASPASPAVITPITVCPGSDVILTATGSGVGSILFYNSISTLIGTVPMPPAITTLNAGGFTPGIYTFGAADLNGACQSLPSTITVNVTDLTAPTAVCQDITVYVDGTGNAAITAGDMDNGSSDNCGSVTFSTTAAAFTCADVGANSVILTVTDGSGNSSSCTGIVTVLDTLAPVANVGTLADVTAQCTVPSLTAPTSTDNCAGAITGTTTTVFPITAIGTTTIIWAYDDGNGNTTTQTQVVTNTGIDASATLSADGGTITANTAGATYAWVNCEFNTTIAGQTEQSFTPTTSGNYAVIVTVGNCVDTSACIHVASAGIDGPWLSPLTVYPNPSMDGYFTVNYNGTIQAIDVVDILGRVIPLPTDLSSGTVNGSQLASGRYMIRITTDSAVLTTKLLLYDKQ